MVLSGSTIVVLHGGAWNIPDHRRQESLDGVRRAAEVARSMLASSNAPLTVSGRKQEGRKRSAVDIAEAVVKALEDEPVFDAGVGSCLNSEGDVEMDAIMMCGRTLSSGAVAALCNVRYPISVARMVMERTPHCLLVGNGAAKFAAEQHVKQVSCEELVTADALAEWHRMQQYTSVVHEHFNGCDTVGCVVLDATGSFAAATSTGGIMNKRAGRVGDSPLIGCGAYADDAYGAASATGHGESIMRVTLTRRALFHVELGANASTAAVKSLAEMREKTEGGCGGLILIDGEGTVAAEFTTERMPWAVLRDGVITTGIDVPYVEESR